MKTSKVFFLKHWISQKTWEMCFFNDETPTGTHVIMIKAREAKELIRLFNIQKADFSNELFEYYHPKF